MAIEVLDLFSAAAGGWSLGMHRAGFTTVAACEVEAWRRALYSENNPNVKVYDDVRTLTADRLLSDLGRLPSVVVGSPPCQDISSANTKGRGVDGERSGLYFEAIRIIGEVRPRWFALENSANLRTRGYDAVKAAVEAIGYACWPCVVRAEDIGANHERARAWLIGCDLEQVTDADPEGVGHESGWAWGYWTHGDGAARARDAAQDGCGPGFPWGRAEPVERVSEQACGDAGDADRESGSARICTAPGEGPNDVGSGLIRSDAEHEGGGPLPAPDAEGIGCFSRTGDDEGPRQQNHWYEPAHGAAPSSTSGAGDASDADQARQAHGCVEPGIRQAKIPDDGRGAGRSDDGSIAGQVGVCAPDRGDAVGGGPSWSLADLADHLWLDDGLSARLASLRADIGDGKGQSAASLVVEAFGDAVIPQIPEAIGRAILRTERALAEIYG